jgi:hypothetical protein
MIALQNGSLMLTFARTMVCTNEWVAAGCNGRLSVARLPLTLHSEEVLQFLEGFLGTFFLQEMAAIETAPGNH